MTPPSEFDRSDRGAFDEPDSALARVMADPARRIGRYVLVSELGRGGMGVVYRAHDTGLNRAVAIKTILGDRGGSGDAARIERFRREAVATAKLRHPGIVAVHEVGVHGAQPFIVMELIEGSDLEGLLAADGGLGPLRLAEVVGETAAALDHAHRFGIVHRDVKPENVLVDRSGRPHVTDFGLAHAGDGDSTHKLTRSGQLMGTPLYMAPEQAGKSRGEIGPAADVYALGGILYRGLVGRPPFHAGSLMELVGKVLFEEPTPPRALDAEIHPDLETIALRCLEKEPGRRYASAAEVADELRRFGAGEPILARPVGRLGRVRRWAGRNRAIASAATAAGVLAVGLAVAGVAVTIQRRGAEAARLRAVAAERARVAAEEKTRVLAAARAEADRSIAAFEAARTAPAPDGVVAAARRTDALLALGLTASDATARAVALGDEDADASRAFDAAMHLGEVAVAGEQWSVAAIAFERALATGADDARARAAAEAVTAARTRAETERRLAVEEILEDARSGELARRPHGWSNAVFDLVTLRHPQTVAILGAALDEVTDALHQVTAAFYRGGARPTNEEARAGASLIEDIDDAVSAAVDAWKRLEPTPADAAPILARSAARLEERASRGLLQTARAKGGETTAVMRSIATAGMVGPRREISTSPTTARELLAEVQSAGVGRRRRRLAQLCCDALGRMALPDEAIAPLGRYVLAEADQQRALPAGVALLILGGDEAEEILARAIARLGTDGVFFTRLARFASNTDRDELIRRVERGAEEAGR